MALNPLLNIDLDYFTNIKNLGDTPDAKIKAVYLDNQFNIVGDYINNEVIPLLNQLVTNSLPGTDVLGTANKLWVNIGDGNTTWTKITDDNIADGGILWQKLVTAAAGSVLAANSAGVFTSVAPTAPHQVLVSRDGELPTWRLINASDIVDRSIDGNKIALGTITAENFQDGLLIPPLFDDFISTIKFMDKGVGTASIADGALTEDKLPKDFYDHFTGGSRLNSSPYAFFNTLPDGFINNTAMIDREIFAQNTTAIKDGSITGDKLSGVIITNRNQIADNAILPNHIADGVIQGSFLQDVLQNKKTADEALGRNLIQAQHLPDNYRVRLGV